MNDPYHRFKSDELMVRDLLAVDRTELANERTLLAWIRTALALLISGASCLHFLDGIAATLGGVALLVLGFGAIVVGTARWARVQRMIVRIKRGDVKLDETASGQHPPKSEAES